MDAMMDALAGHEVEAETMMAYGAGDRGTVRRKPTPPGAVKRARQQAAQYASQGVAVERQAERQKLARALPKVSSMLDTKPIRVRSVAQAERASVRKRAKRVELSAQRKRIGYDRPILVKRREKVAAQQELADVLDAITRPKVPAPERKPGIVGRVIHAGGEAAGAVGEALTSAADVAGEAISGKYLEGLGVPALKAPKEGPGAVAQKTAESIVPDIGELAVTLPSSVAHLASRQAGAAVESVKQGSALPIAKAELQTLRDLAKPYQQLAKDPIRFASSHPVSTYLMLSPAGRLPGRAAGRIARVKGAATLERAPATLPGTPLVEPRTGPRGLVAGKVSRRRERGAEAPRMGEAQVKRRVDELFDYARQRRPDVVASAQREAERRGYDAQRTATHVQGAVGGDLANQFRREFGDSPPDYARERLYKHMKVGSSKAIGARVMRVGGKSFRGTVLPASLKWLTGQAFEPLVRAIATGAGPTSWLRERKVYRELGPEAGAAFRQRTSGGGQLGLTGTAREFQQGKSLAAEFPESGVAAKVSAAAALPGVRHVRQGWRKWSDAVFNGVNGTIERHARRTLTGKAIATGPLMERHLLTLSDKAIQDAARGLFSTENQYALGRELHDMYGKYGKFSPGTRETLLHTTPFAPWYFNAANFMLRVLPRDHPVSSALLADISALEEEWRKQHGLSLRGGERRPGFLLGGAPAGSEGAIVRVGRYTPALPADPAQAVADLFFPQFAAPVENLKGLDWKGQRLPGGVVRHIGEAAKSAAEAHVPGAGQVGRALEREGSVAHRLRLEVDPFAATGKAPGAGSVKRRGLTLRAQPPLTQGSAPLVLR